MNKMVLNFAGMLSVALLAGSLLAACDDDSSTAPNTDNAALSSSTEVTPQPGDALYSSEAFPGISSAEMSSAVEESSSSEALPTTLCKFTLVTQTGYYPMAIITGVTTLCLPMAECDTSALNMWMDQCYEDHATVEGCYSSFKAEAVEDCGDSYSETCETRNGTAYISGRFKGDCGLIVR